MIRSLLLLAIPPQISYEMTGRMDPAKLAKQGVKLEDLIQHVAWYQEVMRLVVNEGE